METEINNNATYRIPSEDNSQNFASPNVKSRKAFDADMTQKTIDVTTQHDTNSLEEMSRIKRET